MRFYIINEKPVVNVEIPPAGVHPSVLDAFKQETWYLAVRKINLPPAQQESDN